jgi:hypothetical protein
MNVLIVLGYILLSLITAIILLLLFVTTIPFIYQSEGYYFNGKGSAYIIVKWFFSIISIRYQIDSTMKKSFEMKLFRHIPLKFKMKPSKETKRSQRRITLRGIKNILKSTARILKSFMPRRFRLDAKIGFEDAYHTGLMCAIAPAFEELFKYDSCSIHLVPVFEEEKFEGSYEIHGKIMILILLIEALKIITSGSFRKVKK